jgi:hypothetical protein
MSVKQRNTRHVGDQNLGSRFGSYRSRAAAERLRAGAGSRGAVAALRYRARFGYGVLGRRVCRRIWIGERSLGRRGERHRVVLGDLFSRQNVIGGLTLQRSTDQPVHPSLLGIGLVRGEVEIELWPCAGAHRMIRCTIDKIVITPVTDYQAADANL